MKRFILVTMCLVPALLSVAQKERNKQLCGLTGKDLLPVRMQVKENILALKKAGRLKFRQNDIDEVNATALAEPMAPISVRFSWPMKPKNTEEFQYYHIGNYTDLDSTGDECIRDYNGGRRTYNGHQGIDIGVGPYGWARKKAGDIYAVVAAPGIIVERHDGEFDGNCDWDNITGSTGRGNHVVVLHADDSTVSFYMHLKNGSLTNKQVGDYVDRGEVLGSIASSGRSTGPHLHFQVNSGWSHPEDDKGYFVDPFAGPQNYTTTVSLWSSQKPYDEPGLYGMETHLGSFFDFYSGNCDSTINLSARTNSFQASQQVGMKTFLIDWVDGSSVSHGLLRPDGTVAFSSARTNGCESQYNTCKNNFTYGPCRVYTMVDTYTLPANPQQGAWTYWMNYNNNITHHYFTVGCLTTQNFSGTQGGHKGFIVSNTITSSVTIGNNSNNDITYRADNYVVLSPGFTATQGCTFVANNKGCVNGN